ncbi:hypothetical protein [Undibacterium sp. TC9W]|uniref:hypothetical protein n=1 Tax=Undibacterium sp. TC9W TaxID=3413053 RepID=UPI003BF25F7B
MNKYLPGFCVLLGLSLGCALFPPVAHAAGPATGGPYVNEAKLHCEQLDVKVETFCQLDKSAEEQCFLQRAQLRHGITGKLTEKFYLYENYLKDQSLITGMLCVKGSNKKNKVILRSTNLGNCKGCEWSDYFSETGEFLGSDRTMFGATNSKPKKMPHNFDEKIGYATDAAGNMVTIEEVYVDRRLRKEK